MIQPQLTRRTPDGWRRRTILTLSWVLVVVCMAAIFWFSQQPADESSALSQGFLARLMDFFSIDIPHWLIRKLAHMAEYCGLGFLLGNALFQTCRRPRPFLSLLVCAAYAGTDELHQFFIPGRACQLRDVLIDTAGACIGIMVGWGLIYLTKVLSSGWRARRNPSA